MTDVVRKNRRVRPYHASLPLSLFYVSSMAMWTSKQCYFVFLVFDHQISNKHDILSISRLFCVNPKGGDSFGTWSMHTAIKGEIRSMQEMDKSKYWHLEDLVNLKQLMM